MTTPKTIPLATPCLGKAEEEAMLEVFHSGWMTHGPYNTRFEEAFARYIGVPHALTVNSCASALELALLANDIRGEVIVPSFTFAASANAVAATGASPVFCDVKIETRNTTVAYLEQALTPRTEAVIVVHYAGQTCDMDAITAFCRQHGLLLVEDSAETIGGDWNGRKAGSFGMGCYSFFPTKNMTTGEGGMLTFQDEATYLKAKAIAGHGIATSTLDREIDPDRPWRRQALFAGHNFRMSNMLAAIGYHQLKKLDAMNNRRRELATRYDRGICERGIPVKTPAVAPQARHVYQMYTVTVDPAQRNRILSGLKAAGVGASVHFDPPVHMHAYYRENHPARFPLPNSELLSESIITLPIYPDMTTEQVDRVLDCLVKETGVGYTAC